jgi:hypothetical protein
VDWWSVNVEARTDGSGRVDEAAAEKLADLLQPYDGSVAGGTEPPRWGVAMSIEAASAAEAVAEATRLVISLAAEAGLPGWPVVRAEAVREDVLDNELSSPPASAR